MIGAVIADYVETQDKYTEFLNDAGKERVKFGIDLLFAQL